MLSASNFLPFDSLLLVLPIVVEVPAQYLILEGQQDYGSAISGYTTLGVFLEVRSNCFGSEVE